MEDSTRFSTASIVTFLFCGLLGTSAAARVVGGEGGGPFHFVCPPNTVLTGLNGQAGNWVDSLQPICAKWNVREKTLGEPIYGPIFGGKGGLPKGVNCPGRQQSSHGGFWSPVETGRMFSTLA